MVLVVVLYGLYKKVDLFDTFIKGGSQSFKLAFTIFPNLLAMIFGVNILLTSGILDTLVAFILPIIKLPVEIISMAVIRPISGNAALALLNRVYQNYGVDSFNSLLASTIQGSTDTTFYVLALYYGSIGVKKIRYAMIGSLFADLIGISMAIFICYLVF